MRFNITRHSICALISENHIGFPLKRKLNWLKGLLEINANTYAKPTETYYISLHDSKKRRGISA